MNVKLLWATPDADKQVAFMARVSNPNNQTNEAISGLLNFCMREGHVSPFEMASVCLEINTTRDIGRQILRHRSFSFQEFSQRYASTDVLPLAELRECRIQDKVNRQNSLPNKELFLGSWWAHAQAQVETLTSDLYHTALARGIAKEQARALLPEGLTTSRIYMNGTLRSWIHYLKSRLDPSTQKEHRLIAQEALAVIREVAPVTMEAFFPKEKE
jgi:thymidylate synthase (FAD)